MFSKSIGAWMLFVVGIAASLTLTGLEVFCIQSQRAVIVNDYGEKRERYHLTPHPAQHR